jgi:diaminopropionate ammonia-lyase
MQAVLNPAVRRDPAYQGLFDDSEYERVAHFCARHPELRPTPLRSLPALAARLGLGQVSIKDESTRWGVEAFKIAGVRYAVDQLGVEALHRGLTCATAGNHGRAVARTARDVGVACTVFLPAVRSDAAALERTTRAARVSAMRADGATVVETTGSYEEAVALAAAHGETAGATIVSDTAWPGYDVVPRLIMAGYTRLFEEAAGEWAAAPDVVLIQGGVGGLVCAAANWFARRFGSRRPFLIACEPDGAACLLESCRAGRAISLRQPCASASVTAPAPLSTMMAGLRCAEPSPAAWPSIHAGIDAFLSVPDQLALEAMAVLREPLPDDPRIDAGPSGACGVAALLALAQDALADTISRRAGMGASTRVMAIVTEGP